jgi:threonine/homoserine/homoserine lactone efflux protein
VLHHLLAILPVFLLACLIWLRCRAPATALFIHRTVRDGRSAGLAAVAAGLFLWAPRPDSDASSRSTRRAS